PPMVDAGITEERTIAPVDFVQPRLHPIPARAIPPGCNPNFLAVDFDLENGLPVGIDNLKSRSLKLRSELSEKGTNQAFSRSSARTFAFSSRTIVDTRASPSTIFTNTT